MFSVCFPHSKNCCLRSNSSPNHMFHFTRYRPATTWALEASTWPQHEGLTEIQKPTWTVGVDLDFFILLSSFFQQKCPSTDSHTTCVDISLDDRWFPSNLNQLGPGFGWKWGPSWKRKGRKSGWCWRVSIHQTKFLLRLWGISCPLQFCKIPVTITPRKKDTNYPNPQTS